MCGFVVLVSPRVPIRQDLIIAMRDRLIHRGPDGAGLWLHSNHRLAMGHRRLAVVDKSDAGIQPMMSKDGLSWIVFNGEIYNFKDLRSELERQGKIFSTNTDTEVLLETLLHWGHDGILRLNGMFSFAMWDGRIKKLLIARDRFGEKPFFIGKGDNGVVIFASEIKAILAHPGMQCMPNKVALSRYGTGTWFENDELTFFEGVSRLPAAHAAWYSQDGIEEKRWRYWVPDYSHINQDLSPREAVEEFSKLMIKSVGLRVKADVSVGSSLSGGLDSSVIVGLISKGCDAKALTQKTFSAVFPEDPTMSESCEILEVVNYTGVESFEVNPNPQGLIKESSLLHWHQEEPFFSASIYLQWCVARLAKLNQTTVLLDGQGADELLGGYQYYFRQRQLDLIDQKKTNLAMRETAKFNRRLKTVSNKYTLSERRFNVSVAYSEDDLKSLGKNAPHPGVSSYGIGIPPHKNGGRLRRTLAEAMQYNSLPMLLRYADRNSMAFSRESRLPFLDYELVDFCISLPDDFYIRNGWQKWILRQAAGSIIPQSIRWRADKVGYAAPLDVWLRGTLKEWAYSRIIDPRLSTVDGFDSIEIISAWDKHQAGVENNSWALWKWISLSEWFSLFDLGWWRSGASTSTLGRSIV